MASGASAELLGLSVQWFQSGHFLDDQIRWELVDSLGSLSAQSLHILIEAMKRDQKVEQNRVETSCSLVIVSGWILHLLPLEVQQVGPIFHFTWSNWILNLLVFGDSICQCATSDASPSQVLALLHIMQFLLVWHGQMLTYSIFLLLLWSWRTWRQSRSDDFCCWCSYLEILTSMRSSHIN